MIQVRLAIRLCLQAQDGGDAVHQLRNANAMRGAYIVLLLEAQLGEISGT